MTSNYYLERLVQIGRAQLLQILAERLNGITLRAPYVSHPSDSIRVCFLP